MHFRSICTALLISAPTAQAQPSIQQSHIEGNVPDEGKFSQLLTRDLLLYFKANDAPKATAVEYRLLRDEPTQSGVSYPKYYAWVQVWAGGERVAEGAVRLAAIGRTRFEITDFVAKARAKNNTTQLESVFPRALVPSILKLAAE